MKRILAIIGLVVALISLSACSANKSPIQAIIDKGELRVGVKVDVPNFGYLNPQTNELEGLEIDLAKLIAQEIFGDANKITMKGVTTQTREAMLDNGELDIIIATFTITDERKTRFHFTQPYFHDAIGFLVGKDSGIQTIDQLDGKVIGVATFGTARTALEAEAEARGIVLNYRTFASYPEISAALMAGNVDAFTVDRSILMGYNNDNTVILDETFNPQDYGIASKLTDKALGTYLDELMAKIEKDGRLKEIVDRWEREQAE